MSLLFLVLSTKLDELTFIDKNGQVHRYIDIFPIDYSLALQMNDGKLTVPNCDFQFQFSKPFCTLSSLSDTSRLLIAMYPSRLTDDAYLNPRLIYKSFSDGVWRTSYGMSANQIKKGKHYTQSLKLVESITLYLESKFNLIWKS